MFVASTTFKHFKIMKRFATVVLTLCIAMMCTTPFEAQSQNRRTGGGNSGNATKKEQPVRSSGSSSKATTQTKKATAPAAQVQDRRTTGSKNTTGSHSTGNKNTGSHNTGQKTIDRNTGSQKNSGHNSGGTTVRPKNNGGGSAEISRRNSDVGRKNIPSNKDVKPSGNHNGKPNGNHGSMHNGNHKPAAVQYHNKPPRPRAPHYERPYLEPRYTPMPSYRYGDHYFGHRIHSLPRGYVTMRVGGLDYYYYDGIYYRPYRLGGYYICRPPRGTTIASTLLNVALNAIIINNIRNEIERAQRAAELSRIYGAGNTGYVIRTSDDYYTANLAGQQGQEYYYQDGVFYILQNGQYYVIEAPIGALVTEIPADYDEIELDGKTYYLVEDTLYKATVIDGALYFEVVSNL